jgi:hypothetical protein
MRPIPRILSWALAAVLAAGQANAAPNDQVMAPSNKQHQELYWQGHEALQQGQWDQALERFRRLEQRLGKDEPAAVDAAVYWQAYALAKANRWAESQAQVERLRREHPKSRWLGEADRLGKAGGRSVGKGEADLVEAALDGLMSAPPDRAVPLLKKVLEGDYSDRNKQRALFVLSQLDDEAARTMVLQTARTGQGKLRREAITMLGMSGSKASLQALESLAVAGDDETQRAVLGAYLVAGHVEGVARVARGSDPAQANLREHAIQLLGAMGAHKELEQLLDPSNDVERTKTVLDALGVAGAVDVLARFAAGEADEELRRQAIRGMGIAGDTGRLTQIYPKLGTSGLRLAALEGLMIAGDSESLTQLYRAARDDDERRAILRMLSITGGDAAIDAIEAVIGQGEGQ